MNNPGRADIGPSAPIYVSAIFTNPTPSNEPASQVGFNLGAGGAL
jgi:hypothetical protein